MTDNFKKAAMFMLDRIAEDGPNSLVDFYYLVSFTRDVQGRPIVSEDFYHRIVSALLNRQNQIAHHKLDYVMSDIEQTGIGPSAFLVRPLGKNNDNWFSYYPVLMEEAVKHFIKDLKKHS
jgi:hypothetical protein